MLSLFVSASLGLSIAACAALLLVAEGACAARRRVAVRATIRD